MNKCERNFMSRRCVGICFNLDTVLCFFFRYPRPFYAQNFISSLLEVIVQEISDETSKAVAGHNAQKKLKLLTLPSSNKQIFVDAVETRNMHFSYAALRAIGIIMVFAAPTKSRDSPPPFGKPSPIESQGISPWNLADLAALLGHEDPVSAVMSEMRQIHDRLKYADDMIGRVLILKDHDRIQVIHDKDTLIREKDAQIMANHALIDHLNTELDTKDALIAEQKREIKEFRQKLQEKNMVIKGQNEEIINKDSVIAAQGMEIAEMRESEIPMAVPVARLLPISSSPVPPPVGGRVIRRPKI